MPSSSPAVHHDRDGKPRCGNSPKTGAPRLVTDLALVTCKACIRKADLKPCGTRAAYNRHLANGEPVDAACREAGLADSHARYAARVIPLGLPGQRRILRPCGTKAAYDRHVAHGEHCATCWEAMKPRWRRRAARHRHTARRRACRRYLATEQEARAAAVTVCDRARDTADARELLMMLGLMERPVATLKAPHGHLMWWSPEAMRADAGRLPRFTPAAAQAALSGREGA